MLAFIRPALFQKKFEGVFTRTSFVSKGSTHSFSKEIKYTETPLKEKPINARSHFEKTYKSETSMKINTKSQFILRRIDINFKI
jgi:hypothetical protein